MESEKTSLEKMDSENMQSVITESKNGVEKRCRKTDTVKLVFRYVPTATHHKCV